jgi:hypothetical protein
MEESIFNEVLDELFSALQSLETQTRALTQFLKDQNIVPADDFAPYLHQAGEASSIRWRAERIRINSLLTSAFKKVDESIATRLDKAGQDQSTTPEKQADRGPSSEANKSRDSKSEGSKNESLKNSDLNTSDLKNKDQNQNDPSTREAPAQETQRPASKPPQSETTKTEAAQPDTSDQTETKPAGAQSGGEANPSKTNEAA